MVGEILKKIENKYNNAIVQQDVMNASMRIQ